MTFRKMTVGLVLGLLVSGAGALANSELQAKAAEFSQLSEKIRLRKFKGGREEASLQVQKAITKPTANRPAGVAPVEMEEEHSED